MRNARGTWFYLVVGAVIGLLLGIVVSVTTDVPLALEAGFGARCARGVALAPGQH